MLPGDAPAGYLGPNIDDLEIFERLPSALRSLLSRRNGFVSRCGSLHVRGACREPAWHALRPVWLGGFFRLAERDPSNRLGLAR